MRKHLKRYLPDHASIHDNRWLRCFGNTLLHPRLWHLNRHSAAGGIAVGLFCGLIPGPFQMLGAALGATLFRVNLPLALITTLYTNPFTIVPLYLLAFQIGLFFTGENTRFVAPPDFEWSGLGGWTLAMGEWIAGLGKPLGVGLLFLALVLAGLGYLLMRLAWRIYLVQAWRHRQRHRAGLNA